MQHTKVELKSRSEWMNSLQGIRSSPFHSWSYCSAMSISSGLPISLHVFEENNKKCVIPLCTREKKKGFFDLVSPYGFGGWAGHDGMLSSKYLKQVFWDFCVSNGYVTAYIMQHPLFPLNRRVWKDQIQENHNLHILDLALEQDRLWTRLRKGHRYDLKKVEREKSSQMVTDPDELIPALKRLYSKTLERVNASSVYNFSDDALKKIIDSQNSLLIGWKDKLGIQAVSLFLISNSGNIGEYFLNASTITGRKYSKSLLWNAVGLLKKSGVRFFNLGGGVKPGDSLDEFKKGFGGNIMPTQTLKIIFSIEKYRELCNLYCHPKGMTNYFPPYWG